TASRRRSDTPLLVPRQRLGTRANPRERGRPARRGSAGGTPALSGVESHRQTERPFLLISIELRYEGVTVGGAATVKVLENARRRGKVVLRIGEPRHQGHEHGRRIDGNGVGAVAAVASEVCGGNDRSRDWIEPGNKTVLAAAIRRSK